MESRQFASNLPESPGLLRPQKWLRANPKMTLPKKILSRQTEITHDFLKEVDKHLEDILAGKADKMYHIKDFAALLFIHPVHLSNTIKLTTGHSPCYFFEEKLMAEAKRLLQDKRITIADIAERLTFDTSNFTKFFKRFEGVTPSAYRMYASGNTSAQKKEVSIALPGRLSGRPPGMLPGTMPDRMPGGRTEAKLSL